MFTQSILTSLLISSIAARNLNLRDSQHFNVVKRQGTLVQSNDPNHFGKCSTPEIKGALGFDNRVEFSFEPSNQADYAHGSAQNIGIITQFICDTLVNNCGASTAAHDLCVATQAAVGQGKNNGAKADQFNAAFGIKTDFAHAVGSISPGSSVPVAAGSSNTTPAAQQASAPAATAVTVTFTAPCPTATPISTVPSASVVTVTITESATSCLAPSATAPTTVTSSSSTLDLGSCSNPEILFENVSKETSMGFEIFSFALTSWRI